VKGFTIAE